MANQENTHIQAVPYLMCLHNFVILYKTLLIKTTTTLQINKKYNFRIFVECLEFIGRFILLIMIMTIKRTNYVLYAIKNIQIHTHFYISVVIFNFKIIFANTFTAWLLRFVHATFNLDDKL
jgi:hypothetical protein